MKLENLPIKIFADGADLATMLRLNSDPLIKGLTTNPSLMRKAGVKNYEAFARSVLVEVTSKPISFEVFADDFDGMERQAREISTWGSNVYVKIPVMNPEGETSLRLIKRLAAAGVRLNITAILTSRQIEEVTQMLNPDIPAIISVFCGRIMDTGRDVPRINGSITDHQFLWASTREPWNIRQAADLGYDIITVPPDILAKAQLMFGMDLTTLSKQTVQMFADDAQAAGYTL